MDIFYGSRLDRNRRELHSTSDENLIKKRTGTINERFVGSLGRAAIRLRPSFPSRSVSSPQAVPGRRRANTATSASGSNTSFGADTPPERWSVFGQLMENEGQFRSPGSVSRPRRTRGRLNDGQGSVRSIRSVTPSLRNVLVHSPVMEEQSPNPFTTTNDETEGEGSDTEPKSDSDSDSDSDTSESSGTQKASRWYSFSLSEVPVLYRNILKSAIAYFIASLFTFSPYLSGFISDLVSYGRGDSHKPLPSGHMVATV